MDAAAKVQDMPPSGGYKPISFKRIPAKTYFSGKTMIAGYLGITAGAAYLFFLNYKQIYIEELEQRSVGIALSPFLIAERDREFLKQCRKNREEEKNLMANVEGWKVGTWYGEPIYKTLPKDTFVTPKIYEYYAHSAYKDFKQRGNFSFWS